MAASLTYVKPATWTIYVSALKDAETTEAKVIALTAKKFSSYSGVERHDGKQIAWPSVVYTDFNDAALLGKAAADAVVKANATLFADITRLAGELSKKVDEAREKLKSTGYTLAYVPDFKAVPTKPGGGTDKQYVFTEGGKQVSTQGAYKGWYMTTHGRITTSAGIEKPDHVLLYSPSGAPRGKYDNPSAAARAIASEVGRVMSGKSGSVNGWEEFSFTVEQ